jgi:hypothetical protein
MEHKLEKMSDMEKDSDMEKNSDMEKDSDMEKYSDMECYMNGRNFFEDDDDENILNRYMRNELMCDDVFCDLDDKIPEEYKNKGVILLIRIKDDELDEYKYKLLYTKDVSTSLNNNHIWDIEILCIQECKNENNLIPLLYEIYNNRIYKKNDLYDISFELYNIIKNISDYINPFYKITKDDDCLKEFYTSKQISIYQSTSQFDSM